MLLAGDVGGTKTVLALFESGVGSLEKPDEGAYPSRDFASLEAICTDFLASKKDYTIRAACFGVPGAVVDGTCKTTNLPWLLAELWPAAKLNVQRCKLLNDLQAAGYGMLPLKHDELAVINPGRS